jgi:endoglucanase
MSSMSFRTLGAVVAALLALGGCGGDPNQNSMVMVSLYPTPTPVGPAPSYPTGLHVAGNQIVDGGGNVVVLRGANRSGSEYKCVQPTNPTIFDGPGDEPSVAAIASWRFNAVRVPLNESCWLGINGASASTSGPIYTAAIGAYVDLLHKYGLIPIIELHWVGPGTDLAVRQQPMPDADHAVDFWTSVATTFAADSGVIFELYNEPYPDSNKDTVAGWTCWRDGCTANENVGTNGAPGTPATYQAVGMQALVTAIRTNTPATNVILLGGLEYSNALTQWLAYAPVDPTGNLGAAWHIYSNNACAADTCWDMAPETVAASVPVVATEIGESDCAGTFITQVMTWLDGQNIGYLAWSWNAFGACVPATKTSGGNPWSLTSSYTTGVPNSDYANTFYQHVIGL